MQEKIQSGLSWLLIIGILLSVVLVIIGALLYLLQEGQAPLAYHHFSKMGLAYTTLLPIFLGALHFNPLSLILLGFLVLVFTQVLRVLALGCFFLQGKEYLLALASFFIFIVLMYSILGNK